jgi:hypothetical protein
MSGPVRLELVARAQSGDREAFDALATAIAGPRPFIESDSDLFCDLMVEALGV